MKSRFQKNLGPGGRLLRALAALGLMVVAVTSWHHSVVAALAVGGAACFVGFEAVRGWCVFRACGIKTRY